MEIPAIITGNYSGASWITGEQNPFGVSIQSLHSESPFEMEF
jgi:hypothetical protein